ncbi:tryptophan synthase subunit alpha [bacterium]|nr:tryptophan synthase subunit alpha [bacterium]
MKRIEQVFFNLVKTNKTAFIPFITAGDPTIDTTRKLVFAFEEAGADIIELGIPFSDPLADGHTIQQASERALKNGVSLRNVIELVSDIREKSSVPIVLMGYYNPIFKYGVSNFVRDSIKAGVDGIIVPDLPPEEAMPIYDETKNSSLAVIFLAAPTSTDDRIKLIGRMTKGFIYYVSLTGVTGARGMLPRTIKRNVSRIKSLTSKPVSVGFGISTPQQAKEVASYADGVIVGSAIVKLIEQNLNKPDPLDKVTAYVKQMVNATKEEN